MSEQQFLLSEADRDILREVINDFKDRRVNVQPRVRRPEPPLPVAPEVYVAKLADGIPALVPVAGTGEGDTAGSATCAIYRRNPADNELILIGRNLTVWNLTASAIPAGWTLVARDKFGDWYAVSGGGGSSLTCKNSTGSPGPFTNVNSMVANSPERFTQSTTPGPSYAVEFDGISQYGTASDASAVSGSGNRSVGFWFKTSYMGSPDAYMFAYGIAAAQEVFAVGIQDSGQLVFTIGTVENGTIDDVADGAWHHLLITWDGVTLTLYYDGAYATSYSPTLNTTLAGTLNFGRQESGAGKYIAADMDDFFMTASVLSSGDAANLYALTASPSDFSPIYYYDFDEGSGTTATDAGSAGLDMTLYNGVTWITGTVPGPTVDVPGEVNLLDIPGPSCIISLSTPATVPNFFTTINLDTVVRDTGSYTSDLPAVIFPLVGWYVVTVIAQWDIPLLAEELLLRISYGAMSPTDTRAATLLSNPWQTLTALMYVSTLGDYFEIEAQVSGDSLNILAMYVFVDSIGAA